MSSNIHSASLTHTHIHKKRTVCTRYGQRSQGHTCAARVQTLYSKCVCIPTIIMLKKRRRLAIASIQIFQELLAIL